MTRAVAQSAGERVRNALYVLVEISYLELINADGNKYHELEVRLRVADSQAPLEHGISGCRARVRDAFAAMWVIRRLISRMKLMRRGSEYDPRHARESNGWTRVSTTWATECATSKIALLIQEFAVMNCFDTIDNEVLNLFNVIDNEVLNLDICYIARGLSPEQHLSRAISEESSLRFANEYLESVLRKCGICRADAINWLPDALNAPSVSLVIE